MNPSASRREFLGDVGRGMLTATLGTALVADLGLSESFADDAAASLNFDRLEPLVSLMQETAPEKLQPMLVSKLSKSQTDLKTLLAAATLANARTFAGQDYIGFHTLMALSPAWKMSQELPSEQRALPVLKVIYRNSERIQQEGGRKNEKLKAVKATGSSPTTQQGKWLQAATRSGDFDRAEKAFATFSNRPIGEAYNHLQWAVQDEINVHRVALAWRAWETLELTGKEHAQTLLRQSVRFCVNSEKNRLARKRPAPEIRTLLPRLLDEHKLLSRKLGKRKADDKWISEFANTVFKGTRPQAAEAAATALAEGFSPETVGEGISLAANLLVLHDRGRTKARPNKPVGSVHGDSVGVHASDAANAWRNIARVTNHRNTVASLIVGAYHTAGQRRWAIDQTWPLAEHLKKIPVTKNPRVLLKEADGAIREKDQGRACAAIAKYAELGGKSRPVFDMLLNFAVSEDGALHAEKYYNTVTEEFASTRPTFRWRQLVALARVTASEYGLKSQGYQQARELLKLKTV